MALETKDDVEPYAFEAFAPVALLLPYYLIALLSVTNCLIHIGVFLSSYKRLSRAWEVIGNRIDRGYERMIGIC